MAIFAPTTSNYSDGYKALTIKALEKRQQDFMNQTAKAEIPKAETPMAVAGVGLGAIGDALQVRNMNVAANEKRNQLSSIMAGVDPTKGPTAQQAAQIYALDNELGGRLMQNQFETGRDTERYRQAEIARGQEDTFRKANDAQKALVEQEAARVLAERQAAEKRLEEQAKETAAKEAEKRLLERPSDDELSKLTRAYNRKEISQADFEARKKKLVAPSVGEQKIINDMKARSIEHQNTMNLLDEAMGLLNSPKGIHAGNYAGGTQSIGEHTPKILQGVPFLPDAETTNQTRRFNKIMGVEVLNALSTMKGASSDKDVQYNMGIVNDPNETLENKKTAVKALQNKLKAYMQMETEGIAEAGGTPAPTVAKVDPKAEARAWLADPKNANDPRRAQIEKMVGAP